MTTAADRRPGSNTQRATLAALLESGRATCSVETAGEILMVGRCTAYEAATAGTLPTIRVGRRLLVPVPRLLEMLGIPLPDEWLPAGVLAERWRDEETASESAELGTDHHACDACGRADAVAFDSRRHKGSGLRAQASPDRSRGGGRGSSGG